MSKHGLPLMCSYLKNLKQRAVIDSSVCTIKVVVAGALQGPTVGLLLFNIFINMLFLLMHLQYQTTTLTTKVYPLVGAIKDTFRP